MATTTGVYQNETERFIYSVALRLFALKGFEATGIRELAQESGVKTSTLYHYMGTKEDLLVRIIEDGLRTFIEDGRVALKESDPAPPGQISGLVRAHIEYQVKYPLLAIVIDTQFEQLTPPRRAGVVRLRDRYEDLWKSAIRAGMEGGDFNVADARLARLALLQMCNGVAAWFSSEGTFSVDEVADEFARFALRMLGMP